MDPLIAPAGLAELLAGTRHTVLVDVRWHLAGPGTRPEYEAAHIPGAVWADLDADFADQPGRHGRHPLPNPARLQATLRRWDVRPGSAVVVYDESDALAAARAWWVLRWAGLADVRVLDGGWQAWLRDGRPVVSGPQPAPPGYNGLAAGGGRAAGSASCVEVRPGGMPVLDADGAGRLAAEGVLVDARAAERFRGEVEPMDPVAGHIPGARNAPSAQDLAPDGRLRPPGELQARYSALGATPQAGRIGRVGAYCGSGVAAARTVLALHLAGVPAALYPGSWSEWAADPSRPVAVGPK